MPDSSLTLGAMRSFLPATTRDDEDRVRMTSRRELGEIVTQLLLDHVDVEEVLAYWDEFRRDDQWVSLLAAVIVYVEQCRGNADAPLPIWSDLDDLGSSGRLFYFYVYALCARGASEYLEHAGASDKVVSATLAALARHANIHRRKWGTVGVDAGWWMLPILRGELVHVGSLQYHYVTLGVGTLSPDIWYDERDALARGPGFRRGDPSVGVHIPQGADLSPSQLERSISDARREVGRMWPTTQRRLATCRSWMLDIRLAHVLPPTSNIVQFQRRFHMVDRYVNDDADVLEFVFRRPGASLSELPRTTTLERYVVDLLERGEHWHTRVGWFDFDTVSYLNA